MGWPNCLRDDAYAARAIEGALRKADRQGRDADAAGVEHLERADEAHADLAEQLVGRHAALVENDLGGLGRAHAQLVFLAARAQARRARARR